MRYPESPAHLPQQDHGASLVILDDVGRRSWA